MDRISNVPSSIIETILCFLPIQEAVRTSILSRDWRYRWIKIPKLVFIEDRSQGPPDEEELMDEAELNDGAELNDEAEHSDGSDFSEGEQPFFELSLRQTMDSKSKLLYDICQVLLMHEGPLREFTLNLATDNDSCTEIDCIIFHLSRKTSVKKLTLNIDGIYNLPLSIYTLSHLTNLYLIGCTIHHRPTFNGFGNLTSLYVKDIKTSTQVLLHLLSSCPLLKTVTLLIDEGTIRCCTYDPCGCIKDYTVTSLFECLPAIETLSIWRGFIECFSLDELPQALPKALVHLKYLWIQDICFMHDLGLSILFLLIKSAPNMEKLMVEIIDEDLCCELPQSGSFTSLDNYSDIWLENLRELEVTAFDDTEATWCFVKLILAKSPMLKKLRILYHAISIDEESRKSEILSSPRASPMVELTFTNITKYIS